MLDAIEGVGARFVACLIRAVEFFDKADDIPALLKSLEAKRRHIEDVGRFVAVETQVRDEQYLVVAQGFDYGCEVLRTFGNMLIDDLVLQFTAGIERLAEGELREKPLFGLTMRVITGVGDVVNAALTRAFALDLDTKDGLDFPLATEERAIREGRFVVLVIVGVGPLAVNLCASDFACGSYGIYQPDVTIVLC